MIVLKILGIIIAALLALGGIIFWGGFLWACFHRQTLRRTREEYTLESDR